MSLVLQGSASECVLVTLLASRHVTISNYKSHPYMDDGVVLSKLVAYSSKLVRHTYTSIYVFIVLLPYIVP